MTVSVIVATRSRADALDRCLRSVRALEDQPHETIVVDNTSGDEPTRVVAERHGARYVRAPSGGLSSARNAGAHAATGEVVAYIDDDALPDRRWINELRESFGDGSVAAVTGRVLPTNPASATLEISIALGWLNLGQVSRLFDCNTRDWFECATFGGIGLGTNMAIRRSLFNTWPGFRESLGLGAPLPGGEENYAFFELIRAGHSILYAADAIVRHPHPDSSDALRARRALVLEHAVAYGLLLFAEEPDYRGRISRHAWRKLVGRIATRSGSASRPPPIPLRPWQIVAAIGHAPLTYFRCRRRSRSEMRPRMNSVASAPAE